MGLFDGASGRGELASTAHVAKLLRAPVMLVVDASAMARSAAAIVHGFARSTPMPLPQRRAQFRRISARNQLIGRIVDIKVDGIMAQIRLSMAASKSLR